VKWSTTIELSNLNVYALDYLTEVSLEADENGLVVLDVRFIESHHHLLNPLLG
jgi:hypothetical protein